MRPVEKGNCPQQNNADVAFGKYQDARSYLIERLGEYCSFCEMHLDAGLAVEHKLPKSAHPHLERTWSNFLLAYPNCNSCKGDQDINLDDLFWPDSENTFHAIVYGPGALVSLNNQLSDEEQAKTRALIQLVGLNRIAGDPRTASDRRWMNREEAWGMAERMLNNLRQNDTPELRESIAHNARCNGYFSVWMTVFASDSDMLCRIIEEFPGTVRGCFDDDGICHRRVVREP